MLDVRCQMLDMMMMTMMIMMMVMMAFASKNIFVQAVLRMRMRPIIQIDFCVFSAARGNQNRRPQIHVHSPKSPYLQGRLPHAQKPNHCHCHSIHSRLIRCPRQRCQGSPSRRVKRQRTQSYVHLPNQPCWQQQSHLPHA